MSNLLSAFRSIGRVLLKSSSGYVCINMTVKQIALQGSWSSQTCKLLVILLKKKTKDK